MGLIPITGLRNKRAPIVRIDGDMVFKGKIDPETRAYVRFLVKFKGMCTKKILDEVKISRSSLYRIVRAQTLNGQCQDGVVRKKVTGRPRKLSHREERLLLRSIPKLRKSDGKFTIKRLMQKAGVDIARVSTKTVQRFLHREGYQYLHARQKGLLTETDLVKRLKFARKMKRDHSTNFWTENISFYLDGVSFVHKYNPADQARAPSGRIWRKQQEGLAFGCTAKGSHCGTGGRVARFMIALSYAKGVVLCEQYETLNGQYFKSLIEREFPRMFLVCNKGRPKLFMQDNDPSQNSALARTAWRRLGAKLVPLPPRSGDIHFIENIFHIAKMALEKDALDRNITHETFQEFSERVATTFHSLDTALIDRTTESMNHRIELLIENKGQRTRY